MSRTFRRTRPHEIRQRYGTRSEEAKEPWWIMCHYPTLTFEQAYERAVARYHRDHPSGHYGIPRAFRRLHGSKAVRLSEYRAIHRGLRRDEWDDHLPDNRFRGVAQYWY